MVVIAAVDRSNRAPAVVTEAAAIAEAFGEPLHVVHVISRSTFVDLEQTETQKTGRGIDMDRIRGFAEGVAADAAADVDNAQPIGLVGSPADMVVDHADESDARFIVLGPRKRSPTGKALFGSVAQTIILQANCSAVTIPVE